MNNENEVIQVHLGYIKDRFDKLDRNVEGLRQEMAKINAEGCSIGRIHQSEISALKGSGRSGAFAGGFTAAIIAGVVAAVQMIFGGKP